MSFLFNDKNKERKELSQKFIVPNTKCVRFVDMGSKQILELSVTEFNPNLNEFYHQQLISYASYLNSTDDIQYDITRTGVRLIFDNLEMAKDFYSYWE